MRCSTGPHPDQLTSIARQRNQTLEVEAASRRARRRKRSPDRRSLWGHQDFLRLWSAESVSRFGSQVSLLGLPLIAITALHASTFQVGLLSTMEFLPFVLIGLPAGVWVDRLRRRPVLIAGDVGRALALASSGASIAGPGAAGLLIQQLTAPVAVLLDAASFLASAAFIGRIRRREPPPPPARGGGGMRREIAEGCATCSGTGCCAGPPPRPPPPTCSAP